MRARTLIAAVGLALIGLAPSMSSEQTCTPRTYWVMPGGGCRFWDGSAYNVCCAVQAFLCGTEGDVPPKSVSQVQLCDGSDYAAALSTWPDSCGEMCSTGSSVDTCRPPREFPSACNDARGDVDCKGAVNVNCAKLNAPFAGKETAAAGGDACRGVAGADPILLGSQSAVTEPFTDFSVDRISRLSITRSYNSSDSNLQAMGTGGVFANAWHHDWEAEVTCTGDACMVLRGTLTGFKFARAGSYPSPDGLETRTVYVPSGGPYTPVHRNLLVQRPTGEWIVFLTDGGEIHFQPSCTSCDSYCTPVTNGGRARLSRVVDAAGNGVSVTYDPGLNVALRLTDDLGHSLELRSVTACGYASELRYDGVLVASYAAAGNMLASATDADGRLLRSYVYGSIGQYWPRLKGVVNESNTTIAEFSYESYGKAIGVVDSRSSIGVSYSEDLRTVSVTEYFRGPLGDTSETTLRGFDYFGHVTKTDRGCSCGPAETVKWTESGQVACEIDEQGHATYREFDGAGRVTHTVEYQGGTCGVPSPMPAEAREEWTEYGISRAVAQGVSLDLDKVTRVRRHSSLAAAGFVDEIFDHSQAGSSIDPVGYSCAPAQMPAGSVLCRKISSGYVTGSLGPVLERHATFFSYDARGRLVRTYGPVNLDLPGASDVAPIEERTYWADGESSARQARLHEVKRYAYPASTPLVTTFDYDLLGVSSITAPDGTVTTVGKDGRGRPRFETVSNASGTMRATTEIRYYDGTEPRLVIRPSGAAERYSYDSKGRLARIDLLSGDPEAPGANPLLGYSESFVYDQAGNPVHAERRDAMGVVTWRQDRAYDVQHHVVWQSNPSLPSASRTWAYSATGFLVQTIDEEGKGTFFVPDSLDRVKRVQRSGVDAAGSPTSLDVAGYAYGAGRDVLEQTVDGAGHPTTYAYDDFGRVERVGSPTIGPTEVRYRYDARGNVVSREDLGTSQTFTYDGLDRLRWRQATNKVDGTTVAYEYRYDVGAAQGRLTTVVDSEKSVAYLYDGLGRLEREVLTVNGVEQPLTTIYGYDSNGAVVNVTYPTGLAVQYQRDPATGQVVAVRNAGDGTAWASNVTHYAFGPVAGLTFGNGKTLTQGFDLRYQPTSVQSGPFSVTLQPSPAGDVAVVRDRSQDVDCTRNVERTLKYDFLDRLSGWSDTAQAGVGICPAEGIGPSSAAYVYVAGTDLVAEQHVPDGAGPLAYAFGYDGQRNVSAVWRYDGTGSTVTAGVCLRHDALGRLVLVGTTSTVAAPGGTACVTDGEVTGALARFKYDGMNRRVARQVNGQWTYVTSDRSGNPISELLMTGDPLTPWLKLRDYVWLDGRLLAQVEYGPAGGRSYYAHLDHLGTPRALTSPTGQLVWSTFQRPYGEVGEKAVPDPETGGTVVTNLRLPGQYDERLLETLGLQGPYYNWNRWYLPGIGRYLELDPIAVAGGFNGFYGPNWYAYAEGNPLRWTDPEGLTWSGNLSFLREWLWGDGQT